MTTYIQRIGQGCRETVDEFETRREAVEMIGEYRLSDLLATFYLSTRAYKGWDDSATTP